MKYIRIETTLGYESFVNTECIESVMSIDGETRIFTKRLDGMFATYEPIHEIMQRICEEQT